MKKYCLIFLFTLLCVPNLWAGQKCASDSTSHGGDPGFYAPGPNASPFAVTVDFDCGCLSVAACHPVLARIQVVGEHCGLIADYVFFAQTSIPLQESDNYVVKITFVGKTYFYYVSYHYS